MENPTDVARSELLPLFEALCAQARRERKADQESFFEVIRGGLEHARDADDLAGPLMELSTSAFRGFVFSPPTLLLLDTALERAQTLSITLSATAEEPH